MCFIFLTVWIQAFFHPSYGSFLIPQLTYLDLEIMYVLPLQFASLLFITLIMFGFHIVVSSLSTLH